MVCRGAGASIKVINSEAQPTLFAEPDSGGNPINSNLTIKCNFGMAFLF